MTRATFLALPRAGARCLSAGIALALTAALCACAHGAGPIPDHLVVKTADIAVATPCAVSGGAEPAYADTDAAIAAAGDLFELAKLYRAGRLQRSEYIGRLKAAVNGCQAPAGTVKQ